MSPRAARSAGLLLYRRASLPPDGSTGGTAEREDGIEVLLVHPGGPLWARRDEGWWSIPKGEIEDGETPIDAAERETAEELGMPAPPGKRIPIGDVVQKSGKQVSAWAALADLDPDSVVSGTFEMEWPPRSGERRSFPEVDRAAWFTLGDARRKLLAGQRPFMDRLAQLARDGLLDMGPTTTREEG